MRSACYQAAGLDAGFWYFDGIQFSHIIVKCNCSQTTVWTVCLWTKFITSHIDFVKVNTDAKHVTVWLRCHQSNSLRPSHDWGCRRQPCSLSPPKSRPPREEAQQCQLSCCYRRSGTKGKLFSFVCFFIITVSLNYDCMTVSSFIYILFAVSLYSGT